MAYERLRLNLGLTRELYDAVTAAAARRGTTTPRYCIEAIEQRIHLEDGRILMAKAAPLLAALWDNDEDAVYDDA